MANELQKQCKLRKGTAHHVAWIEAPLALVGEFVRIKEDGKWSDGWEVIEVADDTALPATWVRERTQDHKNMKKMTDI